MRNPYESPRSLEEKSAGAARSIGRYHFGKSIVFLTIVEVVLAAVLAPSDNSRWLLYAIVAVIVSNAVICLSRHFLYRILAKGGTRTDDRSVIRYMLLTFGCVVTITYLLKAGLLP